MAKKMVYDWADNARMPADVDPQVAGEFLESVRINHNGLIQPHAVVEAARPVSSPIHSVFEWDDSHAAEMYRQDQARNLIRSIRVTVQVSKTETTPVRAFLNVKITEQGGGYVDIGTAMNTPAFQQQILQDALGELRAWQARYKQLSELAVIFEAIEHLQLAA